MRPLVRLLPAALVAAAVAAPSAGAATWSAPVTISAPHTFVGSVGLGPSRSSSTAAWLWQQGIGVDASIGASYASRSPSGRFGPERALPFSGELLAVRAYGGGRVLAMWQRAEPRRSRLDPLHFRVRVAQGGPRGFAAPVTIARTVATSRPQLAVVPGGRAVLSYVTLVPRANRTRVHVATRSASGRWSRPEVISGRGQAKSVAAAIGRRGDVVVAFVRSKKLQARVRRPGRGWGRLQTLATPDGPTQWLMRAAVGDTGAIEVLWRKRRLAQDGRPGVRLLQSSRMSASSSRFAGARTIEPDGAGTPSELVALPGGFAVGYTVPQSPPGTHTIPRVAILAPGAGAPLDVAPASGGVRDVRLAWSKRLGLLATMVQPLPGANSDGVGRGAVLAAGAASFGALEAVTPAENVHEVAPGADGAGNLIAVWSARPEGTGPGIPIENLRSVARTATRGGG